MNTNNLDNNTATPLYLQLKNKLQEDIENGRLAPGSKIPTEFELGEQYGVSRVTVRKALKELSDQGYLERKSGKGTFVAEKKLQRSLSSGVFAFSEMCRSMGLTPGAQTIKKVTTSNLLAQYIAQGVTVKVGCEADDDAIASVTGNLSSVVVSQDSTTKVLSIS